MALFPEKEGRPDYSERPEEISPMTIERKEVVHPVTSQFTGQIKGDNGQNLIQTPQSQTTTIQIPAQEKVLSGWSKGSVGDSLTWLATFWLRMIKKAAFFGWKILGGRS